MTKKELAEHAKKGILGGIFWSIGVTIGFAVVSTFAIAFLSQVDTVPIIGNFMADVVEQTQRSLESR
ncbi:hypothetical protein A2803_05995 [Candidatus Woesebacteria bacterium RIFCSPHIGHO2_01_FULL_44_21]|uniref:Uncharacterized protein n=1 Tax=Candidatus Woesebacteria bacterium RIFCSPHIGHO2_01_FULL_44_21 TaxID=1802503 RepID=A0A1F7YZR9_9BACT|nr:MAG: hypothetical protein A2803_05995 [Candidatus Woesebacteria bacterium RIFCSPHIGHO2_01_FULL_44_21]OGM71069.1 MAG: hypothetical protein A2897_02430 [Candidatus Woesebacteria bacterium RIFCSPLOWO2_01_FULL_44_24b]